MKIIFLDIDGVLVTGEHIRHLRDTEKPTHKGVDEWKANHYKGTMPWTVFDPECVLELNRLVASTGAKIVVSSTWRARGVHEMRKILQSEGVNCEIIGTTPHRYLLDKRLIYDTKGRGLEIAKWLSTDGEEVESFIILDDDSDMVYLSDHLIQTSSEHGLTGFEADIAIDLLNKEQSSIEKGTTHSG